MEANQHLDIQLFYGHVIADLETHEGDELTGKGFNLDQSNDDIK